MGIRRHKRFGRLVTMGIHCLLSFIGLFTADVAAAADSRFIESYAEPIESLLHDKFANSNAGMVIGVIDEHERRIFSAGKLDNTTQAGIDGDTVFSLGSVTKVFTSLLLLDAVRRGEMSLSDPVAKYLAAGVQVPSRNEKRITLGNLAAQDSGLPFHPRVMTGFTDPETGRLDLRKFKAASEAVTVDDLYKELSEFELSQVPGEKFQYSNVGMALLGHAIEQQTGLSYESLVAERICVPLQMNDTRITLSPDQQARRVTGHLADGSRVGHWSFQAMAPSGGLFSTANDMLKFLAAQLGLSPSKLTPQIREAQAIRHTNSPVFGKTAMPWCDNGVYNPPGTTLLGHAGHGFGGLAFTAFDLKNRRGVVVLTNQLKVHPNPIGWTILQGMPFTPQNLSYAVREVVGIGVSLKPDPQTDLIEISNVFPRSPAGEAGIRPDLLIRKINGVSVEKKTPQACVALMAGPIGTKVRLELFDPMNKESIKVELTTNKFLTDTGPNSD